MKFRAKIFSSISLEKLKTRKIWNLLIVHTMKNKEIHKLFKNECYWARNKQARKLINNLILNTIRKIEYSSFSKYYFCHRNYSSLPISRDSTRHCLGLFSLTHVSFRHLQFFENLQKIRVDKWNLLFFDRIESGEIFTEKCMTS